MPECAAICPVAVEMERHILCQMRVRPGGQHISTFCNADTKSTTLKIKLTLGYEVHGPVWMLFASGAVWNNSGFDAKEHWVRRRKPPPPCCF